ncbi:hypothetical protein CFI11_12720 [Thalassococcus sp. S3]|nr:hypothetical protein CFI11_12720 [Thalassococcus sp. S3]
MLVLTMLTIGTTAHAFDAEEMIAHCDAPVAQAIEEAARHDAQSTEWNNLQSAIQQHRRRCGMPMAIACHLSDRPDECYAQVTEAIDARSEAERLKLQTYADEGGALIGALADQITLTTEMRAEDREAYCSQQSSDASAFVGVLGGDTDASCRLDVAVGQWAMLAFSGAAPAALSLLPPQ